MPFALKIRKQILATLDQHIIPVLQNQPVTQLIAGPPFDFSAVEHWATRKVLLPNQKSNPLNVVGTIRISR